MLIRLVLPIWLATAWTGLAERDTAERQRSLDYRALDAGLHHADTLVEGLRKMRSRMSVLPLSFRSCPRGGVCRQQCQLPLSRGCRPPSERIA